MLKVNCKKIIKYKKGFSLIEVMVVIVILSLGMMSVASLIQQSLRVKNISRSHLAAQELAQEGLELIRRVRDNNFIQAGFQGDTPSWDYNITPGTYKMAFDMDTPQTIATLDDGKLYKIDSGEYAGFYAYPSGERETSETSFYRMIEIEYLNADPNKLKVTSTVKWVGAGDEFIYELETVLYDWY
ncbi:MAG: prepilin-type N-terminal cleavage/methylation domain-containing protein [Spirochaetia bacterium]|nr:prepilin-type N-terminal cleavage/methylation domain-containing protein [Spirochaetia bacterium]